MRRGRVLALSGVDCAGKTTQRELLFAALHAFGLRPVTLWTRAGYTPGLAALKAGLRNLRGRTARARGAVAKEAGAYPRRASSLGRLRSRLWVTAALLDLLWVCALRIRLLRALGHTVICDRYLVDCLADFRVNFPDARIERHFLWRLLRRLSARPDAAVCLMIPPEESLARARRKQRFHHESPAVLAERCRAYEALCREFAVPVLDGLRPQDEIAHAVFRRMAVVLPVREVHFSSSY